MKAEQQALFEVQNIRLTPTYTPVVGRITFGADHIGDVNEMVLPDLKGQPPAMNVNTSIQAADAIQDVAETLREMVFDYIKCCGQKGATDQEIQLALKMDGNTERPRRMELLRESRIVNWGFTRRTKTGRSAIVWGAL